MSPKPLSEKGLLEANEKAQHLEAYADNLSLVFLHTSSFPPTSKYRPKYEHLLRY